jgi:hypothetical protein
MSDRKCVNITDDYTGGSGGGRDSGEITGVWHHMGGGISVHEPVVTNATGSASSGAA